MHYTPQLTRAMISDRGGIAGIAPFFDAVRPPDALANFIMEIHSSRFMVTSS